MKIGQYLILLGGILVLIGCNTQSRTSPTVEKYGEATKLFLDYKLGMSKQDFYYHSWALNDKGLVRQGPNNQSVYYELKDELEHPGKMYFYPDFYNDRIYQMRVRFQYSNWAPWNDNLYSDSLQVDVLNLFRQWYGAGFTRKTTNTDGNTRVVYTKQDNNRKILITIRDSRTVFALITDVVARKEIKEEQDTDS